jgi:plastocyanin
MLNEEAGWMRTFNMKRFSAPIALLVLSLLLPMTALSAIHEVTVGDNFFSPSELTIQPGDTVRWINAAGGAGHDVDSNDGLWTPPPISNEWTFEFTFSNPGSFAYHCNPHQAIGMDGVITVEAATAVAELELQSINAVNGAYAPGDIMTISSSIMNSGGEDSGSFSISYYASENSNISSGDHLLGSANVSNVAMGATLNHQTMVTIPESVPAGDYFIGAIINFSDSNASDNVNHDATTVTFLGLFFINAGLNDAWVSGDAPLQGFFFTVFPDLKFFFLSWFTFDSVIPAGEDTAVFGADDQRWVTGSGFYDGNSVTLNMELTSGGIFNASDPLATQDLGYGTITIVFISCNEAILTYNFPSVGLSGQITLTRVVGDNIPLCDLLNEELQMNPP